MECEKICDVTNDYEFKFDSLLASYRVHQWFVQASLYHEASVLWSIQFYPTTIEN